MIKVVASAAMSLDGYIDDCSKERLRLSSPEDWAEVLALRAKCDAILVGAGTLRADNPSLTVKDSAARLEAGLTQELVKVTVTANGCLDIDSRFFTVGDGRKIVFISDSADQYSIDRLQGHAEVIVMHDISATKIVAKMDEIGCRTLMVEGGTEILTMFLSENMIDELRVAIAPFFVGECHAPKFVNSAKFPADKLNRMKLSRVEKLGDMAVMHYLKPNSDSDYLNQTIELSRSCPKCSTSYCVGAIIVTNNGEVFTGYTHETAPNNHAEEEAIIKAINADANLEGATIYCSMEPCSQRASKPKSCSQLIIENRLSRVVIASREPDKFVVCNGVELLREAGIVVDISDELSKEVMDVNSHVLRS